MRCNWALLRGHVGNPLGTQWENIGVKGEKWILFLSPKANRKNHGNPENMVNMFISYRHKLNITIFDLNY